MQRDPRLTFVAPKRQQDAGPAEGSPRRILRLSRAPLLFFSGLALLLAWMFFQAGAASSASRTFYVDSVSGNDANSGTSPSTAWKSLSKAASAPLNPGDRLLFKRSASWTGALSLSRSGTASSRITIGAYGTGPLPLIKEASTCLSIRASYTIVRELHVDNCGWAGIAIEGSYNTVEASVATRNITGIYVKTTATNNRIVHNDIRDNNKLVDGDNGAFGILLHGDYNEIAYNKITGSDALSLNYGREGAAVELYGGRFNNIHHNHAWENHDFAELGNSRSTDNTFAYNLFTSSLPESVFFVTRGAGSVYGPVAKTVLENNTAYLTATDSQGIVCHDGCGPDILRMRNNIIQAVWKAGYADAPFDEDYNLYYGGLVQFNMGQHSKFGDPRFAGATALDLRLASTSPAIDAGVDLGHKVDFSGVSVPQDGNGDGAAKPDMGAYEALGSVSSTATPTPTSTAPSATATPTSVPATHSPTPIPATPSPTPTTAPSTATPTPTRTATPSATPSGPVNASVQALGETSPVGSSGDAADDPAVWVNPLDPALTLVIGTQRTSSGGLRVYDLGGVELQNLAIGKVNNVDVRYGFPLSTGPVDIVVGTHLDDGKLVIYKVDPHGRTLLDIRAPSVPSLSAYGFCLYRSPFSGKFYGFVSQSGSGTWRQVEFFESDGKITYSIVRTINHALASASGLSTEKMEGCVADDRTGYVYLSEEEVGIFRYGAEPSAGSANEQVASVSSGHLSADVEGLAIYPVGSNGGYLIASSQGADNYSIFDLPTRAYIGRLSVASGVVDGTSHTDGITAVNASLGDSLASGLFVAQDDSNSTPGNSGNQNFKLVAWQAIAQAMKLP